MSGDKSNESVMSTVGRRLLTLRGAATVGVVALTNVIAVLAIVNFVLLPWASENVMAVIRPPTLRPMESVGIVVGLMIVALLVQPMLALVFVASLIEEVTGIGLPWPQEILTWGGLIAANSVVWSATVYIAQASWLERRKRIMRRAEEEMSIRDAEWAQPTRAS